MKLHSLEIAGGERVHVDAELQIDDGRIRTISRRVASNEGPHELDPSRSDGHGSPDGGARASAELLTPGLVDLQVNGFAGVDLLSSAIDEMPELGRRLARRGVTSFCPTLISHPLERLEARLAELARAFENWPKDAARPLGFHLEGPFLNPAKRGAHPKAHLAPPSVEAMQRLVEASGNRVRLVTLAPELPGALEVLDWLVARNIAVSIGHSLASYEEAIQAFDRGASLCTHWGNAMAPWTQREPGMQAACLNDERARVCLISDLHHVHPGLLRLVLKNKSRQGVVLVSDAIAAADLEDGDHVLGDERVRVEGGVCRNQDGVLAGAALPLDECVRRFALATGLDGDGIARVGAHNPARAILAADAGNISEGARADLVAWRWGQDGPRIERVWIAGEEIAL